MLNITNAYKYYGNIPIINNISLTISQGNIVGLAGPSGGGKSTLLRCLQKLIKLDSGEIECRGKSGFMFQDFQLFPHMNVLENITYAPLCILKQKNAKEQAIALLDKLGLADKQFHYPAELSGGQKQRVALARSLIMQPDLLFCDEPTSGLDVSTIDDVVALLTEIHAMGVTIVIASHDLDFLTKVTMRIIVLKQGRIVADIDPKTTSLQQLKNYY